MKDTCEEGARRCMGRGRHMQEVFQQNLRRRVENGGRKTHRVQGNRQHQAQVVTFPMKAAEGA